MIWSLYKKLPSIYSFIVPALCLFLCFSTRGRKEGDDDDEVQLDMFREHLHTSPGAVILHLELGEQATDGNEMNIIYIRSTHVPTEKWYILFFTWTWIFKRQSSC